MDSMTLFKRMTGGVALVFTLLMLVGCETTNYNNDALNLKTTYTENKFHKGDVVVVTFSGIDIIIPQHEERVKEDGTITLPLIGPVKADGLSPGQLQEEIRRRYVEGKYYAASLTVTVRAPIRYFFVGGEVRNSGQYEWLEGMNVAKAIQKAGYFTEFAKRSKIRVTRQEGKTFTVNYDKIIEHPEKDVPVLPNDTITVPKKW